MAETTQGQAPAVDLNEKTGLFDFNESWSCDVNPFFWKNRFKAVYWGNNSVSAAELLELIILYEGKKTAEDAEPRGTDLGLSFKQ